ncbi:MAG TPA: chromate transporter [Kiritimatiellia bacterium]|nr:chromate transporter [Kiritimatiellia bacterium]HRU70316.1 chromate transporter [Kiritimatiellia bacterium]
MNLFFKLAYAFFKIGLLTVGGGLAMIPIIQHEMVSRGWLDNRQFLDILGIAQMTPGAMSVNTATFVGYRVIADGCSGSLALAVVGALVGTLAVCAPSLVCVNLFGAFWNRNRNHPCMLRIFDVLRPLVTGLVITAAGLLVLHALWGDSFRAMTERLPDVRMAAIALAAFALTAFSKVSPVYILLGGACAGMVLGLM